MIHTGNPWRPGDSKDKVMNPESYSEPCNNCYPSKTRQARNFAGALIDHIKSGLDNAKEEEVKRRQDVCRECDKLNTSKHEDGRCMVCGCYMIVKAKWSSSKCPLGKW